MERKFKRIFALFLSLCIILSGTVTFPLADVYGTTASHTGSKYIDTIEFGVANEPNVPVKVKIDASKEEYQITCPDNLSMGKIVVMPETGIKGCYINASCGDSKETCKNMLMPMFNNKPFDKKIIGGWLSTDKKFPIGKKMWIKFEIKDGNQSGANILKTYWFNITRSVELNSVSISDDSGKQTDGIRQAGRRFVVDTSSDRINLTCNAKTPAKARIKIGENILTSGLPFPINLADYTQNGNTVIPVDVEYASNDNLSVGSRYEIVVNRVDYTPKVTITSNLAVEKHPSSPEKKLIKCKQNEVAKLIANVEAPAGSKISYQWYISDRHITSTLLPIEGATNSELNLPTKYAREFMYYCVVTNTVNGSVFKSESEKFILSVQPTTASEAEIINTSSDSIVFEGQNDGILSVVARSNDADGKLSFQWYVASDDMSEGSPIGSNADGKPVEKGYQSDVKIDTSKAGTYYYYCAVTSSLDLGDGTVSKNSDTKSNRIKVTVKNPASFFEGEGTKDKPFLIKDAQDFEEIRGLVEKGNSFAGTYFKMAPSSGAITLPVDWKQIGTLRTGYSDTATGVGVSPFSGNLDGNGCKIVIPKGGKSLFRFVREASIKNLKIYGEEINGAGLIDEYFVDYGTDGKYDTGVPKVVDINNVTLLSGSKTLLSGFIHGNGSGKNIVTIKNSKVESGVVVGYKKDYSFIGSFAGFVNGTIMSCSSAADVYGVDAVGGIIGAKGQAMGPCIVNNSTFSGTVTATGTLIGGIIGSGYDGKGTAPNTPVVTINNCLVSGNVQGSDKVGGILGGEPGCENCWANGKGSVSNNAFAGNIMATAQNPTSLGTIVGFMKSYNNNQTMGHNYYKEGCGADRGIGSVEILKSEDIDLSKTGTAVTESDIKDGTVANRLNKAPGSYKNWINDKDGNLYISDKPVVYELAISGKYKTEYNVGEKFTADGMVVTGTYTDGTTKVIPLSECKFEGFDSTKAGNLKVTVKYGSAEVTYPVSVRYLKPTDVSVSVKIYGDGCHDSDKDGNVHTLAGGNLELWATGTYTGNQNATVLEAIKKIMQDNDLTFMNPSGNYITTVTNNKTGVTIGEFTNGKNSGWMYTLNGKHPLLGVSEQFLDDGDEIVLHYTDDYTKEEGSEDWGPGGEEKPPVVDPNPDQGGGEKPPVVDPDTGNKPGENTGDKPADKPADKPSAKPDADKKPGSPQTGDENEMLLLGIALLASAGVFTAVARKRKTIK